jgi:hypothetical protein
LGSLSTACRRTAELACRVNGAMPVELLEVTPATPATPVTAATGA